MKKKLTSIFMVFALIMTSLVTPVVAAKSPNIIKIKGKNYTVNQSVKNGVKTVIVSDGDNKSIVTYDTNKNLIKTILKDKTEKIISKKDFDLTSTETRNTIQQKTESINSSLNISTRAYDAGTIISQSSDMWWGYRYAVRAYNNPTTNPNKWWLRLDTGSQKIVYESSNNSSNLQAYRSTVRSMRANQYGVYAAVGTTAAATIAAFLAGAATLGLTTIIGVCTAVGGTVQVAYMAYTVWSLSNDADYYYNLSF